MTDTKPTATVTGQSVTLHVDGYREVPYLWAPGRIRVSTVLLEYGATTILRAHVYGAWVDAHDELTNAPADQQYKAPGGDASKWPNWVADLARQHTPGMVRANMLREVADICDEAGAAYASKALNDQADGAFTLMERFLRKANEAEYVATPCSVGGCDPGGEPCSTHERLMAHAEGDHELCAPDCGTAPAREV